LQILAENGGSEFRRLLHEATTFSHEHPGIRYHYVHRGRAVTVSDLLPLRQWKKTRLYNEFFVELGMQEQLGGSFPSAFPDLMGAIVSRTRRTFTRRDRLLLDVVRFHASEAFQTAQWKAPDFASGSQTHAGGLACLFFLRVEDPVGELAKLRALGLGPRATEVLYWVMQGKTNEEIAIILQVSPRTVEKHLEHILVQLGVENRTAAALAAAAVSSRSART
jgi:DNA-binding CsgD family transcriptional regulator